MDKHRKYYLDEDDFYEEANKPNFFQTKLTFTMGQFMLFAAVFWFLAALTGFFATGFFL